MTYNQTLPNFRKILSDNWNLLKLYNRLKHVFKEQPITAYRRNENLRDVIGDTTIENNKVVGKQKPISNSSYCKPSISRTKDLCCKQVAPTTTFKGTVTLKTYQIFPQLNYKSSHIMYLLECLKCQVQYLEKSETDFNIRLNNHSKHVARKNIIPTSNHFNIEGDNFNIHAKFLLIE